MRSAPAPSPLDGSRRGGAFLPSAAQGLVKRDQIGGDGALAFDPGVLALVKGALRFENALEIGQAVAIKIQGQGDCLLIGARGALEGFEAGLFLGVGGQGRFHIGEGGQHGLLIGRQRLVRARVLHTHIGADASGVENPPLHGGAGRPKPAAAPARALAAAS